MLMFIQKILIALFALIDRLVYGILIVVYEMFINISEAGLFGQDTIHSFSTRIYALLGLFMVFKVSVSLVSYIMNPDNFSKGDVGAPAIIKGFVFALVGIIAVPYIFEFAFAIQRVVLANNILGNFILGSADTAIGTDNSDDWIHNAGVRMASTTLETFVRPNDDIDGIDDDCIMSPKDCDAFRRLFDDPSVVDNIYSKDPTAIGDLLDIDDFLTRTVKSGNKKVFAVKYTWLISTLAGGFIAYILLMFCIDIGVRAVKLSFLQLIAPIPLIAKIDPKKGNKMFESWLKECTTTYLDVFLRLLAIYFALFVIMNLTTVYRVTDPTGVGYRGITKLYVRVFLLLGTLIFAKQLPNLLGTIFGIDFKAMGGFTLNPAKKMRDNALFGNAVANGMGFMGRSALKVGSLAGGLAGLGVGAIGNKAKPIAQGIASGIASSKFGQAAGKFGNTISTSTTVRKIGAWGSKVGNNVKGKFGKIAQSQGGQMIGETFGQIGADAQGTIGEAIPFVKNRADRELNAIKNATTAITNSENRALEKIKGNEAGWLSKEYRRKLAYVDSIKNQDTSGMDEKQMRAHAKKISDAEYDLDTWLNNDAKYAYIDLNNGGSTGSPVSISAIDDDGNTVTQSLSFSDVFDSASGDGTLTGYQKDYERSIRVGGDDVNLSGITTEADATKKKGTAKEQHTQLGRFKGRANNINRDRMTTQQAKSGK